MHPDPQVPGPGGSEEVSIWCRAVSKTFVVRAREIHALSDVDLVVKRGETVVLRGPSGAGKSTLLGLLAGLERPSAGTLAVDGNRLERLSGTELAAWGRRRVGFVFQDHNLLLGWSAEENVAAALVGSGLSRPEKRAQTRQALQRLGLADRLDHLPGELSVGERQRVAVARALIKQPALILADEPTADVDEASARLIIEQLLEAAHRPEVTLIVATHGPVAPELAGRRLRLESGRLVLDDCGR
ncbi:MAG: ABC transporter ATP-binding protein [Thermoguttaceae bacterium]